VGKVFLVQRHFIKTENDLQMPYEINANAHKNTFAHLAKPPLVFH